MKRVILVCSLICLSTFVAAAIPSRERLEFIRRQQRLYNPQKGRHYDAAQMDRLPTKYLPSSGETFEILSYWVPAESLHFFEASRVPPTLRTFFQRVDGGKRYIRFLVHPQSKKFYREFLKNALPSEDRLLGTPTASSRTLLIWNPESALEPFLAKLSLDAMIGETFRCITAEEIARSVGTTQVLEQLKDRLPREFHFFPEVMGMMPKGMNRGGFIIRRFPESLSDDELLNFYLTSNLFVPSNAAGGQTLAESGSLLNTPTLMKRPMARELRNQWRSLEAARFARSYLEPFGDQWVDLALLGITMNPHGQNLYVELDPKDYFRSKGRYLHQDFGDFSLDLDFLRDELDIDIDGLPQILGLNKDYRQFQNTVELHSSVFVYLNGGLLRHLALSSDALLSSRGSDTLPFQAFFRRYTEDYLITALETRVGKKLWSPKDDAMDYYWLPRLVRKARAFAESERKRKSCRELLASGFAARIQAALSAGVSRRE